ncbi:hypothetical protein [Flavobacterium sp. ABG]|uniref:hypothetical protein n=1 Tax=Flavobacterium sp. ABG TaxID=1423322 RepID=UPI00064A95A0|nr:hypothetical protein [Flavobacterium sp. ABG]KLT71624.1 hypothetical protein AB674_00755 [Flavobacterium sp. ABG]
MRNPIILFVVLCIAAILFTTFHQNILDLKALEIQSLSKSISQKQIDKFITSSQSKEYLNYIFVPINIITKVTIIALFLFFGCFLVDLKIKFKQILTFCIKAEFIFLLPVLYEIIYFKFIQTNHTYSDIQNFSSLSVLNAIGYKNVENWFFYPLQTLNLFELIYWLVLACYIGKITETNSKRGLLIVASSYGSALLLWVTVTMFLTLNYS